MNVVAPFIIALRPSRNLAWLLGLAHLAAAGAVAVLELPLWLAIALVLSLAAHGVTQVARLALLRGADSVVAVEAGRASGVPFRQRDGAWHEGRLVGSSYVAPGLTVLNLKLAGARRLRHVVILPDAVDAEDFRRLRVWLRWSRHDGTVRHA
jgi:toxin CptA